MVEESGQSSGVSEQTSLLAMETERDANLLAIRKKHGDTIRLNVGCGKRVFDGWTGIDASPDRSAADLIAQAWDIPLPDGCVDEVQAIHLIEHMVPWKAKDALREWFRLMKPGATIVMEQPDLIKCCQNLLNGIQGKHPDQLGLWGIFGDSRDNDEFMLHRFGYTFESLSKVLKEVGFIKMKEHQTVYHRPGRFVRDFRVEARKPGSA